jgi:hypothetical protein
MLLISGWRMACARRFIIENRENPGMRSNRIVAALPGGMFVLATITGCGGEPEGQTDLAKLPPPSQAVIDAAKAQAPSKARPKFGSPPRSEMRKP